MTRLLPAFSPVNESLMIAAIPPRRPHKALGLLHCLHARPLAFLKPNCAARSTGRDQTKARAQRTSYPKSGRHLKPCERQQKQPKGNCREMPHYNKAEHCAEQSLRVCAVGSPWRATLSVTYFEHQRRVANRPAENPTPAEPIARAAWFECVRSPSAVFWASSALSRTGVLLIS